MSTPLDTLRLARALIADPKRWCQRVSALDKRNRPIAATNKNACKWCATGALATVSSQDLQAASVAVDELEHVLAEAGGLDLTMFNDTRTHHEVIALFDKTIEKLSKKAGA